MTNRDDELETAQPMLASQSVRMPWKPASRDAPTSIRYVARGIGAWMGFCCRIIVAFSRRADILSGRTGPGTMYTVPSLAAELAISTTPVREALLDLAGSGFLTPIRNRGFRVEEMTRAHLDHPFEMRALLERHALATLAQRGLSDAAELRVLADAVAAAIQAEGGRGYLEADRTFHQALLERVGNPLLTKLVMDMRDRMRLYGFDTPAGRRRQLASVDEHYRLIELAAVGDTQGIATLITLHIMEWKQVFADAMPERRL